MESGWNPSWSLNELACSVSPSVRVIGRCDRAVACVATIRKRTKIRPMTDQNPNAERSPPEFPTQAGRFAMPWDLSEWFPREQLWGWTLEEVGRLGWNQPQLIAFLAKRPNYQPRWLLSLLGYAYAVGVFEDTEAADLARSDPQVRALAGTFCPRPRELRDFRRANRGLLKWLLVQLFERGLRERFHIERSRLPAGLHRWVVRAASARLDLARTMIRATEEA